MKKIIAIVLSLMLTLLTACGEPAEALTGYGLERTTEVFIQAANGDTAAKFEDAEDVAAIVEAFSHLRSTGKKETEATDYTYVVCLLRGRSELLHAAVASEYIAIDGMRYKPGNMGEFLNLITDMHRAHKDPEDISETASVKIMRNGNGHKQAHIKDPADVARIVRAVAAVDKREADYLPLDGWTYNIKLLDESGGLIVAITPYSALMAYGSCCYYDDDACGELNDLVSELLAEYTTKPAEQPPTDA